MGRLGQEGSAGRQSWNGAVGEIAACKVVKQFSMLCLEGFIILSKKMTSSAPFFFFFINTCNLPRPQVLAAEAPHA